jgi:hypothetical protein
MLTDTDPETERVHLTLLREAGPGRRAHMAFSISATVIDLSRRAIRQSLPDASEEEVGLEFVARHYGAELAEDVRRYLTARRER